MHAQYIHDALTAYIYTVHQFHVALPSHGPDLSAFAVLGVFCGLLLLMLFMAKPVSCAVKVVRMRMRGGRVTPLSTTPNVQHSWEEEEVAGDATDEGALAGQLQV